MEKNSTLMPVNNVEKRASTERKHVKKNRCYKPPWDNPLGACKASLDSLYSLSSVGMLRV